MDPKSEGFYVVWLYWIKRYMTARLKSRDSLPALLQELQRGYSLEVVDSQALVAGRASAVK